MNKSDSNPAVEERDGTMNLYEYRQTVGVVSGVTPLTSSGLNTDPEEGYIVWDDIRFNRHLETHKPHNYICKPHQEPTINSCLLCNRILLKKKNKQNNLTFLPFFSVGLLHYQLE